MLICGLICEAIGLTTARDGINSSSPLIVIITLQRHPLLLLSFYLFWLHFLPMILSCSSSSSITGYVLYHLLSNSTGPATCLAATSPNFRPVQRM